MVKTEHERALVGRILAKPDSLYRTSITPEHLGDPLCRAVLTAINADVVQGIEPNLLTVTQHPGLSSRAADVASLTSDAALGNEAYYEREILTAWRSRKITDLGRLIIDTAGEPDKAIDTIERAIQELTTSSETDRVYSTAELVKSAIATIEERYHAKGQLPGLSTGIPKLDVILGGLQPRKIYYIGARPSQGKSAILLNMATSIALSGKPAGIISAESSKEELVLRDFANLGNVDSKRIASGMLKQVDFADITNAAERLYNAPLHIYDQPNVGITRLISIAKMMRRRHKIEALFVDYVQIIQSTLRSAPKRDQVAEISLSLKALSRQLDIPVIAAAQLTRDAQGRRPTLADFSDASQLEKDADAAILLQQERDDADRLVRVWARVEKHRDGPTGSVPLQFKAEYVRFVEEAREAS